MTQATGSRERKTSTSKHEISELFLSFFLKVIFAFWIRILNTDRNSMFTFLSTLVGQCASGLHFAVDSDVVS
jgi:hypothetical protein